MRPVRPAVRLAALGLALVLAPVPATAAGAPTQPPAPAVWAVQLPWSPAQPSLRIDYDSSDTSAPVQGAYEPTTTAFPDGVDRWTTATWELTGVELQGAENCGADLRLAGSPGVAVHEVVLDTAPPGHPGASVRLVFAAAGQGPFAANEEDGLHQVCPGGDQGDSTYTTARVAGQSAEVFVANPTGGTYLYLQVDRGSRLYALHPTTLWATVTFAATQPAAPWPESTFAALRAQGIRYAEINLPWGALEPSPGRFDLSTLEADLAHAHAAGVGLIPIFWYSVWAGNPPGWITAYDVGSSGARAQVPAWWDPFNRHAYFTYVARTVAAIRDRPGFAGVFLDYGWLDDLWGPPPGGQGVDGYAPADVARFRAWLPTQYPSLEAFDRTWGVAYRSWDQVPAARPGDPLFPVYQAFRRWSVEETYERLSALVRAETSAPLYYYWGGSLGGLGVAWNDPDVLFQVARRYRATVVLDDADHTGLAVLFGSLAAAYGVPLLLEWTPRPSGLHAEIAEFLGHLGFAFPEAAGMDFFLYQGGREYQVGFPRYAAAIPALSRVRGRYPLQPVAVYLSTAAALQDPSGLSGLTQRLGELWREAHVAFTVVTDQELAAHVVQLGAFRAVLPLDGADAAVRAYAAHGGHVVSDAAGLRAYAPTYVAFDPGAADVVEAVPVADPAARTAWLLLSGWQTSWRYQGVLSLDLAALGLPSGSYHLVDALTGRPVPSYAAAGRLEAAVDVLPGTFLVWEVAPGPGASLPRPPSPSGLAAGVTPYFAAP
jgi:hypothetical protein